VRDGPDGREPPVKLSVILVIACSTALPLGAPVWAQTLPRPNPPPQVCVGSKCASSAAPTVTPPAGSAVSTTTSAVTSTPAGSLKFHPGFYPYFNYAHGVDMVHFGTGQDGRDLQLINSLAPNDNVAGIAIAIMWRTIDTGTTAPNYDWTVIDAYLKAVKSVGKRLRVRVQDATYTSGWSVANGQRTVPDWLVAKYGAENVLINYSQPPRGVAAKRYNPDVTGAYIAMMQAMAARYDSDPSFEGVTMFEETAMSVDVSGNAVTPATPGADWSQGSYSDPAGSATMFGQLYRLLQACRAAFATSNVQLPGNYLFRSADNVQSWNAILQAIQANKAMAGGPDSWIADWVYPDVPYTGPQSAPQLGGSPSTNPLYYRSLPPDELYRGWAPGYPSYVGKILFGPDAEASDFGGYITQDMTPIPTLADLWKVHGAALDKAQYFFFDINYLPSGNYGGAPQQWSTGQYPWVQSAGSTNTTNPYK